MDLGIQGRTALVLGSTSGLGWATAECLGKEGAHVVVTGRRAELTAERAASLPSSLGITLDLTEAGAARNAVAMTAERFGDIDILVLNSGGPPPGSAAALTSADLGDALETLLLAQVDLVSLVVDGMRERHWGRILAIGSSGVITALPNLARSNVGRAALAAYIKTLAAEVAPHGVTVNMIVPGRIDTDRVGQLDENAAQAAGLSADEVRRRSQAKIPSGRYGRPQEFGAVAAFLCSELASYITGCAIRVDGGLVPAL